VELSNLQRQIVHKTDSIGADKVESAKKMLLDINPEIKITTVTSINKDNIQDVIMEADVVLDGTDNFDARYMINKACVDMKKVLVSASVIKMEGQVSVFRGYEPDMPCYQCLYTGNSGATNTCINNGILAPVVGVVGSIQAVETIKILLNIGTDLTKKILMFDATGMSFNTININKLGNCEVCNGSLKK